MSDIISLNHLLGEENTYCSQEPSELILECTDISNEIFTLGNNIITLEAAKKIKDITGGTGPLPTNSTRDDDDFYSEPNREIVVDFEAKLVDEKKQLWERIKILFRKIKEWIESVIYKIISQLRQDASFINKQENIVNIARNIANGATAKTYQFSRAPEDTAELLFKDVQSIVDHINANLNNRTASESNDWPIDGNTLLGVKLGITDSDVSKQVEKIILGKNTTSTQTLNNVHVSDRTFVYFITAAPTKLKAIRKAWSDAEMKLPDFEVLENQLEYVRAVTFQAQKAVTTSLSIMSKLILHFASIAKSVASSKVLNER
jgi:hypothetical protein